MEITCDGSLYSARIRRHCRRIWASIHVKSSWESHENLPPTFLIFLRNAQTLHKEFQASKIPLRTQRIRWRTFCGREFPVFIVSEDGWKVEERMDWGVQDPGCRRSLLTLLRPLRWLL